MDTRESARQFLRLSTVLTIVVLSACKAADPQLTKPRISAPPPPQTPVTKVDYVPAPPPPPRPVPPIEPSAPPPPPEKKVFKKHFSLSYSQVTDQQSSFKLNTITSYFQVNKENESVNGLTSKDISVQENGVPVANFALAADTERNDQVADIVFLVDITGTMVELIESAKLRLKEFVKTSRARGYHTRMCIATFGDYVVQHCTRFYDNNPRDKSTEKQVVGLMRELNNLHAYRGQGHDPGWPDLDENPMGALIDTAKVAPWAPGSRRFVILVTDWGFLYSPDNQGWIGKTPQTIGQHAPTMKEVNQAIKDAQMNVFAATRMQHDHKGQHLVWDGYNTPFQGEPGIVQSSNGEYFDFDKVLSGEISLATILERILLRINTTYKLTYVVDKNPGLDPTLPVDRRNVEIKLNDATRGLVKRGSVLSSMPTGRPNYKQVWKLSDYPILNDSMKVKIDGKDVAPAEYTVSGGEIRFKSAPPSGAKLAFEFLYEEISRNLDLKPLSFEVPVDERTVKVTLNGKEAQPGKNVVFTQIKGNTALQVVHEALDPADIRQNKGLTLEATAEFR